jgi:antitoxin CptB
MSEMPRLRWLCRRGMKELDLLLVKYLEHSYTDAPAADQQAFKSILEMQDPELYDLILGRTECGKKDVARVIKILRDSV